VQFRSAHALRAFVSRGALVTELIPKSPKSKESTCPTPPPVLFLGLFRYWNKTEGLPERGSGRGKRSCGVDRETGGRRVSLSLPFSRDGQRELAMALSYLNAGGYITMQIGAGMDGFRVTLTIKGLEYARSLDTRLGRADLWYREHKDGLIWLLITVFVSFVTTVVTN
jgi:hypothetical protein